MLTLAPGVTKQALYEEFLKDENIKSVKIGFSSIGRKIYQ